MGSPTSGALNTALTHNSLPNFVWLTPDKCHDMHDNCYGTQVLTGDRWIASWVPRIIHSSAYQGGGTAIFITWDEGWEPNLDDHNHESCVGRTTDKLLPRGDDRDQPVHAAWHPVGNVLQPLLAAEDRRDAARDSRHVGPRARHSTIALMDPFKL